MGPLRYTLTEQRSETLLQLEELCHLAQAEQLNSFAPVKEEEEEDGICSALGRGREVRLLVHLWRVLFADADLFT